MKITRRTIIVLCAFVLSILAVVPGTNAFASGTQLSYTVVAHPLGKPQGCPGGDMCIYNKGGGGNLCIATPGNEPNLGACSWTDEAVFNNGFSGNPNGVVAMNYLGDYHGAWTCIDTGHYWLYTAAYYFNNGSGQQGYTHSVERSIGSFHWQSHDCGSSTHP
jgi:hypothetical protein